MGGLYFIDKMSKVSFIRDFSNKSCDMVDRENTLSRKEFEGWFCFCHSYLGIPPLLLIRWKFAFESIFILRKHFQFRWAKTRYPQRQLIINEIMLRSTDYWGSSLKALDEGIVVMKFSSSKGWFVLTILSASFELNFGAFDIVYTPSPFSWYLGCLKLFVRVLTGSRFVSWEDNAHRLWNVQLCQNHIMGKPPAVFPAFIGHALEISKHPSKQSLVCWQHDFAG